jgi:hypothetical protein
VLALLSCDCWRAAAYSPKIQLQAYSLPPLPAIVICCALLATDTAGYLQDRLGVTAGWPCHQP